MAAFIVRRLVGVVTVILGVSIVIFLLVQLAPGDAATVLLGPQATEAAKNIRRFEVRNDGVSGGEVWAALEGDDPGAPDGMKIDAEGNLFCTGPGGIHVFAPNGQMLGVIRVPEVTANFNWGDTDRKTLYICATSSLYSCRTLLPGPASA